MRRLALTVLLAATPAAADPYVVRKSPVEDTKAVIATLTAKKGEVAPADAVVADAKLALPPHEALKVVEAPPGPPVLATVLAEIYRQDARTRRAVAGKVWQAFADVDFIVHSDDSFGATFILADSNFQGLAISLVFGPASSTALPLLVSPAIYVVLRDDERRRPNQERQA